MIYFLIWYMLQITKCIVRISVPKNACARELLCPPVVHAWKIHCAETLSKGWGQKWKTSSWFEHYKSYFYQPFQDQHRFLFFEMFGNKFSLRRFFGTFEEFFKGVFFQPAQGSLYITVTIMAPGADTQRLGMVKFLSQTLNVGYIYLYLPYKLTKCR